MSNYFENSAMENVVIVWSGTCIDCHRQWTMSSNEKEWWDEKLKAGMTFPKRCKSCRAKKRVPSKESVVGQSVIHTLKQMATDAINDFYEGRGDLLAQQLSDLSRELEEK